LQTGLVSATTRPGVKEPKERAMKRTTRISAALTIPLLIAVAISPALAAPPAGTDNALEFRIGAFFPDGGGDLWNDNQAVFTQKMSDFDDVTLGFSYVRSLTNIVELGVNIDFYDGVDLSAYRDFEDEDGFAILHDTRLTMVPVTVDVRVLPGGRYKGRRGRAINKPVFYVGAGGGLNNWRYEEFGDFIDFDDPQLPIYYDEFEDSGTALELHALAGVELPVARRFNLVFEGRYSWSDDKLDEDFAGFGDIRLDGPSFHFGGAFRF
jgi:hypothetical protein